MSTTVNNFARVLTNTYQQRCYCLLLIQINIRCPDMVRDVTAVCKQNKGRC